MNLAQKLLNFFQGSWRVFRTIENTGVFNGEAIFEPSETNPDELVYFEKGVFEFFDRVDSKFDASRSFIYRIIDQKDIQVYFNDKVSENELFHSFGCPRIADQNQNKIELKNKHLCLSDTYDVKYEIDFEKNQFQITYDVNGPEKSYISKTLFNKLS